MMDSIIKQQYINMHKEFRAYIRTQKGEKGQFLTNLMEAAENHLTRIICSYIDESYTILYDDSMTLEKLVQYYVIIEEHENWFTTGNGHTAWKSLKYYLSFKSLKEGKDWQPIYEETKKKRANEKAEREKVYKEEFTEGNVISSHYDRRERDPRARLRCIEYHGCRCSICGFDFAKEYGEVGTNFIEVHHVIPISNTAGEHEVDPLNDLIPVCSNCHSILHRRSPNPYLPEEVRNMLKRGCHESRNDARIEHSL